MSYHTKPVTPTRPRAIHQGGHWIPPVRSLAQKPVAHYLCGEVATCFSSGLATDTHKGRTPSFLFLNFLVLKWFG